MNLELKQVKDLTEKKQVKDSFMGAVAHAASKGEKTVEIDGKTHPVTMKPETHKAIKKSKKDNGTGGKNMAKEEITWEQAVRKAQATAVQTSKEYWEEEIRKNQEGWGSKPTTKVKL